MLLDNKINSSPIKNTNFNFNEDNIIITEEIIDNILNVNMKIDIVKPFSNNRVGVVYGLYATSMGIGGITVIQVCKKLIDTSNTLLCTGKQGEVMLESMKVALTLACNIVPIDILIKNGFVSSNNNNNKDNKNVRMVKIKKIVKIVKIIKKILKIIF